MKEQMENNQNRNNHLNSILMSHVKDLINNPEFVHSDWYLEYHMEVVDKIADVLCDIHKDADRVTVKTLVWMHDYGKFIDFGNQHELSVSSGKDKLNEIGYEEEYTNKIIDYIRQIDEKNNLSESPIEVQIVSTADGVSHLVGPFHYAWFHEHPEIPLRDIMRSNVEKIQNEWEKKIVLPEVKSIFNQRHIISLEQNSHV